MYILTDLVYLLTYKQILMKCSKTKKNISQLCNMKQLIRSKESIKKSPNDSMEKPQCLMPHKSVLPQVTRKNITTFHVKYRQCGKHFSQEWHFILFWWYKSVYKSQVGTHPLLRTRTVSPRVLPPADICEIKALNASRPL